MAVELSKNGLEWTLVLSGRVGITEAVLLHTCAREALAGPSRCVRVRLDAVESLDAAATQILLALRRDLVGAGRACVLEGASSPVADTWRLAGIRLS